MRKRFFLCEVFPYADHDEGDDEDYNDVGIYILDFDSADDDDDRKLLFIPVDTYYDQPGDGLMVSSIKGAKSIKVQN